MGDRTYVTLTLLAEQLEEALPLIEAEDGSPEDTSENTPFVHLGFYEVNYGDLRCLSALQAAGIAYESRWESGADYGGGIEYGRFTEAGEPRSLQLHDGGENPSIHALIKLLDSPQELRQYILDHQAAITPLPWDNQVEYGRRYRARRLIAPA